ncbi:MAG: hypothetical protein VXZ39_03260, partial [Planctomycetota bacterium]|nr:hypothetical protein [Planctomycetota bacterium]
MELELTDPSVFKQREVKDLEELTVFEPERELGVQREGAGAELILQVEHAQRRVDDERPAALRDRAQGAQVIDDHDAVEREVAGRVAVEVDR